MVPPPEDEDDGEDEMVRERKRSSDNEDQVNFKRLACQIPARIDQMITFKFSDEAEGETLASS